FSLHLPHYLSFVLTGKHHSNVTSLGCHTCLWDFSKHDYHRWVHQEGIHEKLATDVPAGETSTIKLHHKALAIGCGLHDSSAALIPYLEQFRDPFVLLSTGTWNIALNPFNRSPLTAKELQQDCLCYLSYTGQEVKASRLFAGAVHQQHTARIADHFHRQ